MKKYLDAFQNIWKDILFKIAGNLFPFYSGFIILVFINSQEIDRIFDTQSFILYSSTFLFTSFYLFYKALDKSKNELISLLFLVLLIILVALLYAFTLLNSPDSVLALSYWSYIVFGISIFIYIYYECKIYSISDSSKPYKESEKQFSDLKNSFKNFGEHE